MEASYTVNHAEFAPQGPKFTKTSAVYAFEMDSALLRSGS